MANPILKRIRKSNLTPIDIAILLEKHIGDSSNQEYCKEAIEACLTIHNEKMHFVPIALKAMLKTESDYCKIIKLIIGNYRNPDNHKIYIK